MANQGKDRIENIIGPTSSFHGDLVCEGGVRIDGVLVGSVKSKGNVIIGETAKVEANLEGENVSVAGVVKGNITALGRLEILARGQVLGDVSVESLIIDEGGVFTGKVRMKELSGDASPSKESGQSM